MVSGDSALGHCPALCPGDAGEGSGLVWESLGLSLVLWGSNCLGGCREHRWRMERDLGGSYIWNCLQFGVRFRGSPRRFQGQHHLVQSCLWGAEGMGSRLTVLCVEHLAQAERWKRGSGKRDATAGFLGGCPSPSCSEIVSRQGPGPSSKQLLLPCPQPLWSLNSSRTQEPVSKGQGLRGLVYVALPASQSLLDWSQDWEGKRAPSPSLPPPPLSLKPFASIPGLTEGQEGGHTGRHA